MFVVSAFRIYESYTNFSDAHKRYSELCKSGKYSMVEMKQLETHDKYEYYSSVAIFLK